MGAPFQAVIAAYSANIQSVARHILPGGKVSGGWYWVTVPWRPDRTPSLGISLKTGIWKDWGRDEGGDVIALIRRLHSCDAKRACEELAKILGISTRPGKPMLRHNVGPLMLYCRDCRHAWLRWPDEYFCTKTLGLDEEPISARLARRNDKSWPCGPHAALYEPHT